MHRRIGFLIKSLKFADPPTCTYLSIKTGYQLPHLFELKSTHTQTEISASANYTVSIIAVNKDPLVVWKSQNKTISPFL